MPTKQDSKLSTLSEKTTRPTKGRKGFTGNTPNTSRRRVERSKFSLTSTQDVSTVRQMAEANSGPRAQNSPEVIKVHNEPNRPRSSKSLETSLKIVDVFLRSFLLVFPKQASFVSKHTVGIKLCALALPFLPAVEAGDWFKLVKEKLNFIFAYATKQEELPPTPKNLAYGMNPKILLGGPIGRVMNQKATSGMTRDRTMIWLNTVLHGIKKALPTIDDSILEDALLAHEEKLSTRKASPPPEILSTIRRTSFELFQDIKLKDFKLNSPISHNSCYENSRLGGGAHGFWHVKQEPRELISFEYLGKHESFYTNRDLTVERVREERQGLLDALLDQELPFSETYVSKKWNVIGLKEPLKTRIVTAGPAALNGLFGDIQKSMFKAMTPFWQLKLTRGEEIIQDDSIRFSAALPEQEDEDLQWISGDYSDATNSLNSWTTSAAIDGFRSGLRPLLEANLLDADLCYKSGRSATQVSGQLMGSLFSFPLLCCINLALFRHVWESRLGRRVPLDSLPVLVNGDDILFRQDDIFYREWARVTSLCGLEPSIGKCYRSQHFCIVNSRIWRTRSSLLTEPVPYVNMGIVDGLIKSDTRDPTVSSTSQKCTTLVNSLGPLLKDWGSRDVKPLKDAVVQRTDVTWSGLDNFHLGLEGSNLPHQKAEDEWKGWYRSEKILEKLRGKRGREEEARSMAFGVKQSNAGPFGAFLFTGKPEQTSFPLGCVRKAKDLKPSYLDYVKCLVARYKREREEELRDEYLAELFSDKARRLQDPGSRILFASFDVLGIHPGIFDNSQQQETKTCEGLSSSVVEFYCGFPDGNTSLAF